MGLWTKAQVTFFVYFGISSPPVTAFLFGFPFAFTITALLAFFFSYYIFGIAKKIVKKKNKK